MDRVPKRISRMGIERDMYLNKRVFWDDLTPFFPKRREGSRVGGFAC